jgi:hypothetical protein
MTLSLVNLDQVTRQYMLEEIELDISNDKLYLSPRLSDTGRNNFASLLKEAAHNHDDT